MAADPPTTRPPDDGDDDLVAYLDGELEEVDTQAVESKLAVDEDARKKAEKLKKTFDLLDYLPKPEPSPNFASRTLTQINPTAERPSSPALPVTSGQSGIPVQQSAAVTRPPGLSFVWKAVAWTVVLLLTTAIGYVGHLLARPHLEASGPAKRTSEQVRLLERLPLLIGVDDFDFLKQLDQSDFFAEAEPEEAASKAVVETLTSTELEQLENVFKNYPAVRQQQLRKLDEELSQDERQAHLLGVLEQYAIWLDRLPDAYRKEVLQAPAPVERLETIRRVKSRLWREGLPVAVRDRIQEADAAAREQLIADRKQQDAKRKLVWDVAKTEWVNIRMDRRPWPFDNPDLMRQVDDYVDKVVKPRLTNPDRADLDLLRREVSTNPDWFKWYLYGAFLVRNQDQHPMYPEAANPKHMVKKVDDLPKPFVNQLAKNGGPIRRQLNNHPANNKWPDFADAVLKESHELKVPVPHGLQLGPNKASEYLPPVQEFIEKELVRKLGKAEREELTKAEGGAWPDHSRKVIELARKYDLSVPGVTPPGDPARWDQVYRSRLKPR